MDSGREDLIALYDDDGKLRSRPHPDPETIAEALALIRVRGMILEHGSFSEGVEKTIAAIRRREGG
jgi:DNA-binding IclR family transcriptional regulator